MTRLACLMTGPVNILLLKPWMLHHGYLFGFDNLYVGEDEPLSQSALIILKEFEVLGVKFLQSSSKEVLQELIADKDIHVVMSLRCNDFIALANNDGLTVARTPINNEIQQISEYGEFSSGRFILESWPGFLDVFRYVAERFPIFVNHPQHSNKIRVSDLVYLRVNQTQFNEGEEPEYSYITLKYRRLWQQLSVMFDVSSLYSDWQTSQANDGLEKFLIWDFDKAPFNAKSYLAANSDLLANPNFDPFDHFVRFGVLEGRRHAPTGDASKLSFEFLERVREVRKDGVSGYVGLSHVAARANRLSDSDEILRLGILQYGDNEKLLFEFALTAMYRYSYQEAVERWNRCISFYPGNIESHQLLVHTHREAGNFDEAESVLENAMKRFPRSPKLLVSKINIAIARNDSKTVKEIWLDLLKNFPEDREVRRLAGEIATFLGNTSENEDGDSEARLFAGPVVVDMSDNEISNTLKRLGFSDTRAMREFFLKFESLGNSCEFGLVQRRYGAEPISLLRWNSITLSNLILGLETRFAGLTEPENLFLKISRRELILHDHKFSLAMHTFVMEGTVDRHQFLTQQIKRAKYLCRNLLDNLDEGEKLFVYLDETDQPKSEIHRLAKAIRSYGKSTLLYVRITNDPARFGTVEFSEEGLLIGYISRPGRSSSGEWMIDFENWEAVCVSSEKLWQKLRSQ